MLYWSYPVRLMCFLRWAYSAVVILILLLLWPALQRVPLRPVWLWLAAESQHRRRGLTKVLQLSLPLRLRLRLQLRLRRLQLRSRLQLQLRLPSYLRLQPPAQQLRRQLPLRRRRVHQLSANGRREQRASRSAHRRRSWRNECGA